MKVLVTGAAGFIGAETCYQLLMRGDEVWGYDCINDYYAVELKLARLERLGIDAKQSVSRQVLVGWMGFHFVKADIEDSEFLNDLFAAQQFDAVIHLAAQAGVRYSIQNPMAYIQSNIVGFANILEACRHNPVKHLVYASSSSVYGANAKIPFSTDDIVANPVSLYAATKKSNELMAHSYSHLYKLPTTGLRFFTVYGPWGRPDMAPMLFANAILNGKPISIFNNGEMKRDFTYIDDVVKGVLQVVDTPPDKNPKRTVAAGECLYYKLYNIGRGEPIDLLDFIGILERELGMEARKEFLGMQDGDVPITWADTARLQAEISYRPETSIREGVHELAQWLKTQGNSSPNPQMKL